MTRRRGRRARRPGVEPACAPTERDRELLKVPRYGRNVVSRKPARRTGLSEIYADDPTYADVAG